VAKTHFSTTLAGQNQPHTIALHLEFVKRTQVGPATFTVKQVKLGRQTSTVHISLAQDGREEVVGYFTNTNLNTEQGVTFPTGWTLHPSTPAVDLKKLKDGSDPLWGEHTGMPFPEFRKASNRVRFFYPRNGHAMKSLKDEWVCFSDGSRFTQESLGLICDMWPQIVESYTHKKDPYDLDAPLEPERLDNSKIFWYPTVLLNLDVKKALPPEGVEWLFARVQAKQIKNGRLDLEVIILDETGDVVALSHHVVMVLPASRNVAARRKVGDGNSKI